MNYRTQKAQGIYALRQIGIGGVKSLPFRIIQSADDIEKGFQSLAENYGPDLFARPCPENPAHGFVDSRRVISVDEAIQVFNEAVAADPQAEMILMPRVNAVCNAIYSGNYLAMGPGHDGATGGKDSFGFRVNQGTLSPNLIASSRINVAKDEVPYVEMVYGTIGSGELAAYATQVRSGPRTSGDANLVFTTGTISQVYVPTQRDLDDLLWWKDKAVELAKIPGLLVWHPGGTPACHVAVHCAENHVNYLTYNPMTGDTNPPKAGEELICPETPDLRDPREVRRGIIGATTLTDMSFIDALNAVLFGLHQSTINLTPLGSRLIGSASMLCVRLSTAACLGELRHRRRDGSNAAFFRKNRQYVLRKAWEDHFVAQKMMSLALKSFFETRWPSGYGGKRWGVCTMRNMQLADACLNVFKDPSMGSVKELSEALNILIHTVHNGGWQFNKFANPSVMDAASISSPGFILNSGYGVFRAMTAEPINEDRFMSIRKTRALTEIRKRVDIDQIAADALAAANEKLGKLTPEQIAEKAEKSEKQQQALADMQAKYEEDKAKAQLIAEIAATDLISKYGVPGFIQAYANPNHGMFHIQFKYDNPSINPQKGYYSCNIAFDKSECDAADFMGIQPTQNSLANSKAMYVSCWTHFNKVWATKLGGHSMVVTTIFEMIKAAMLNNQES